MSKQTFSKPNEGDTEVILTQEDGDDKRVGDKILGCYLWSVGGRGDNYI